jgi:hypothetical protein
MREAIEFLGQVLEPPPPDQIAEDFHKRMFAATQMMPDFHTSLKPALEQVQQLGKCTGTPLGFWIHEPPTLTWAGGTSAAQGAG